MHMMTMENAGQRVFTADEEQRILALFARHLTANANRLKDAKPFIINDPEFRKDGLNLDAAEMENSERLNSFWSHHPLQQPPMRLW